MRGDENESEPGCWLPTLVLMILAGLLFWRYADTLAMWSQRLMFELLRGSLPAGVR